VCIGRQAAAKMGANGGAVPDAMIQPLGGADPEAPQ
jgi:hypothetical protein